MIFNSNQFLFFFTAVVFLYFALSYRFRVTLLLGASYYFYMCSKPEYVLLVILSTVVNYYGALWIGKTEIKAKRKKFLIFGLVFNIGLLFAFKYYSFLNDSLQEIFHHYNLFYRLPAFRLLLPIGISFYTFKSMSYIIDVYRGVIKPERRLGPFALYVAFFPQVLAGPIERGTRLIPQFYEKFDFNYQRVTEGIRLMLWGFFQKIVIADNLANLVDPIYNNPTKFQGIPLILATFFFAFQIYCDFSGYSDIAIGAAQIMGYTTMKNFDRPYFSKSIAEFWRRWHISLSTWFRDYLYIPLGGNRVSTPRWYFNLFFVMLICGLWHGANWTFIIWGAFHGFYLIVSVFTQRTRKKIHQFMGLNKVPELHGYLKIGTTFSWVCFAWIFFRANSLSDALVIIKNIFLGWEGILRFDRHQMTPFIGPLRFEFMVGTISMMVLILVHLLEKRGSIVQIISRKPLWVRWSIYYATLLVILLFGNIGQKQFIYFQF